MRMPHGKIPGAKPPGYDSRSIKVLGVQYFGYAERSWQSDDRYADEEDALEDRADT